MKVQSGKVRHIALVSVEAIWHRDFDPDNPCVPQFVNIPPGYTNGPFFIRQFEHLGVRWVAYHFEVWERAG